LGIKLELIKEVSQLFKKKRMKGHYWKYWNRKKTRWHRRGRKFYSLLSPYSTIPRWL